MTVAEVGPVGAPGKRFLQTYLIAWIPIFLIGIVVSRLLWPFRSLFGDMLLAYVRRQYHLFSTVVLCAVLAAYVSYAMRTWPPASRSEAARVGALWVVVWLASTVLMSLAQGTFTGLLDSLRDPRAAGLFLVSYVVIGVGPYWFHSRAVRGAVPASWRPVVTMVAFGALEMAIVGLSFRLPLQSAELLFFSGVLGPAPLLTMLDDHAPRFYACLIAALWAAAIGYGVGQAPRPRWVWLAIVLWVLSAVAAIVGLYLAGSAMRGP